MSQNTIKTWQRRCIDGSSNFATFNEARDAEIDDLRARVTELEATATEQSDGVTHTAVPAALTDAVKRVLSLPRGTSGRIILELSDELELSNALSKHLLAAGPGAKDSELVAAVGFLLTTSEPRSRQQQEYWPMLEKAWRKATDAVIKAATAGNGAEK